MLEKEIRKIVRKYCCCGGSGPFGITALSPPIDAPGVHDPVVLFNSETKEFWFWGGDSWELYSS